MAVSLQIDLQGGDRITGQISNGSWSVSLLADRVVFSKTNPALSLAGNYTTVIQSSDGSMGASIGTVNVSSAGAVKWTMTLADGTKLSESTTLSKDGAWPLYSQPYKNGGVIIGWMQFGAKSERRFRWAVCLDQTERLRRFIPAGVDEGRECFRFVLQGALEGFRRSSTVIFNGGGLSSPITNSVMWSVNNKVVAGSGLKLSVNTKSGLFEGTVAVAPGKGGTVPFQGVLFEKDNVGLGFFMGSGQSGAVIFGPNN